MKDEVLKPEMKHLQMKISLMGKGTGRNLEQDQFGLLYRFSV